MMVGDGSSTVNHDQRKGSLCKNPCQLLLDGPKELTIQSAFPWKVVL